jgi:hypothetical protein
MTTLKTALIWLGLVWALSIAAITLALTMISKQGREREREHDLDERMGEE